MQRLIDLREINVDVGSEYPKIMSWFPSGGEEAVHNLVTPHFEIQGN